MSAARKVAAGKRVAGKRVAGKGAAAKGVAGKRAPAAKRPAKRAAPNRAPMKGTAAPPLTGRGGVRVWGKNHPAAQLTEQQVIRFRRLVRTGKATVGELAAEVGCGHARISMAVRGQTWAHLNEVAPPVPGGSRGVR